MCLWFALHMLAACRTAPEKNIMHASHLSIFYQCCMARLLQATAFEKQQWTVLNAAVALMGYFCAAWLVDKKWYGRRFMQTFGFFMMFVLFLICAVAFNVLTASQEGLHAFQFLYFFSSFWNQFGPNATTWLVAGESD